METVVLSRRKLIDIKQPVFQALSLEARKKNVSLKKYIEDMLENAVYSGMDSSISPAIRRLIGSANPTGYDVSRIDDERLQYLLSK